MQIYSGNFKGFEVTPEELLDPCRNLNIFEKILVDCYQRGGSILNALSCYYSGNFKTGKKKETQFANTSYIERIGTSDNKSNYIVPSTKSYKADNQEVVKTESDVVIEQLKPLSKIVYPHYVIRGVVKEN